MIDVHAHLNDEKLIDNIQEYIEKAKENGVEKIFCVGFDIPSSKKAIKIAEKFENVYAVIGVHPDNAKDFDANAENFLLENGKNKKVIAIGEIGLDYHFPPVDKELQKKVFVEQLKIADTLHLPIQIHTRDAIHDTLETIKENKQYINNSGIFHCFSESYETLEIVKKLGFKISVGGVSTFKNAKNIQEIISKTPLDMIMLETDCPYLAPHPHRGELNHPAFVKITAEKVAELTGKSLQEIDEITTQNVKAVFKI